MNDNERSLKIKVISVVPNTDLTGFQGAKQHGTMLVYECDTKDGRKVNTKNLTDDHLKWNTGLVEDLKNIVSGEEVFVTIKHQEKEGRKFSSWKRITKERPNLGGITMGGNTFTKTDSLGAQRGNAISNGTSLVVAGVNSGVLKVKSVEDLVDKALQAAQLILNNSESLTVGNKKPNPVPMGELGTLDDDAGNPF